MMGRLTRGLPGFAISELVGTARVNTVAITTRPDTKQSLFFISTSFPNSVWREKRGVEEVHESVFSRSGATARRRQQGLCRELRCTAA
jgi:hypothetical protein